MDSNLPDNPWVKDSDLAYTEDGDPECGICGEPRPIEEKIDGIPMCAECFSFQRAQDLPECESCGKKSETVEAWRQKEMCARCILLAKEIASQAKKDCQGA